MWEYGLDRAGPGDGHVAGTCKGVNEPSGFHKMRGFS